MVQNRKKLKFRKRYLLVFLAVGALILISCCAAIDTRFDEAAWREKVLSVKTEDLYAPNHDGEVFFNPWMPMEKKSFLTLLRWRFSSRQEYSEEETQYLPKVVPDPAARIKAIEGDDFIFWVGHGTFFMRIGGQYWLTDPIFSDRAVLPKRKTPPGISMDEIMAVVGAEPINVIISHNHHDHLDKKSIQALPDQTRFYVPLGNKDYLVRLGRAHIVEMNWWESLTLEGDVQLVCLPMQHWSRRIGQGFNEALWASFLIAAPDVSVYFDGDGGYFIGYREIGRRFPGIDYALIPTTAYHPRWFMHYAHMDVDEAVDAFHDLGASYFIPTQWGTFRLGDNPTGYPRLDLERAIAERELDPDRFLLLDIGGLHRIGKKEP